jgi:hypothetical protein
MERRAAREARFRRAAPRRMIFAMTTTNPGLASDPLSRALDHLAAGQWQAAHEIVQPDKSTLAAWLHGIVHILEGDLENARGWYRRAERPFPGAEAVQTEIAAVRQELARR